MQVVCGGARLIFFPRSLPCMLSYPKNLRPSMQWYIGKTCKSKKNYAMPISRIDKGCSFCVTSKPIYQLRFVLFFSQLALVKLIVYSVFVLHAILPLRRHCSQKRNTHFSKNMQLALCRPFLYCMCERQTWHTFSNVILCSRGSANGHAIVPLTTKGKFEAGTH